MTNQVHEDIDAELDKQILNALETDPTAAMMNVARQRLKDLNFTKVPTDNDATTEMAKRLGMENDPLILKLPGLDETPDAATG